MATTVTWRIGCDRCDAVVEEGAGRYVDLRRTRERRLRLDAETELRSKDGAPFGRLRLELEGAILCPDCRRYVVQEGAASLQHQLDAKLAEPLDPTGT